MEDEEQPQQSGPEEDKQLKAACHYFIAKICEDEGAHCRPNEVRLISIHHTTGTKLGKTVSKQSVACLTELFCGYARTVPPTKHCLSPTDLWLCRNLCHRRGVLCAACQAVHSAT